MSLFQRSSSDALVAAFDIGSASIGGSLIMVNPAKPPRIVYTVRHAVAVQREMQQDRLFLIMGDALTAVADDLRKNGARHLSFTRFGTSRPVAAYCTFTAPWPSVYARRVTYTHDEPFTVTPALLDTLAAQELAAITKEYGGEGGAGDLVEHRIADLKVNGYSVSRINGQQGVAVEMIIYASFIPRQIADFVRERIREAFSLRTRNVSIGSFMLSFFTVVRDIWHKEEDFLLVDITGEMTEVAVVKDGTLVETVSFPIGKNVYIREVAKDGNITSHEASSLVSLYLTGATHDQLLSGIEQSMERADHEWYSLFKTVTARLTESFFAPGRVFLSVSDPFSKRYVNLIEHSGSAEREIQPSINGTYKVIVLHASALRHTVEFPKETPHDPFLAVNALHMHIMRRDQK